MANRKILLDVDTGVDDACAIALAHASRDIEILGVTTCMGNLAVEQTTKNTLDLVEHLGIGARVAKGAADPIMRERWVNDKEVTKLPIAGLGDAQTQPDEQGAVSFMAAALERSAEKVTLVALAPLTNIAKLMLFYPDLVEEKVDEIVLMGGGRSGGNITAAAELNFYADPEAAQTVFNFGKRVVMCGLEVCRRAFITQSDNERFKRIDTVPAAVFSQCVESWLASFRKRGEGEDGYVVVYDVAPIVYLLRPELFSAELAHVEIETNSKMCDGMSVCDTRPGFVEDGEDPVDEKTTAVVLDVDRERFIEQIEITLREGEKNE